MPFIERAGARLYYESYGSGFPVVTFAAGNLKSQIALWKRSFIDPTRRPPWLDPTVDLVPPFRVVVMDQRYAGQSTAPMTADAGWHSYADDHLAIMDALGIEHCHLLGVCIGVPFALALCQRVPERIASAVLQNPVGRSAVNGPLFHHEFAEWAAEYQRDHPATDPQALAAFGRNMFEHDFVFTVTRAEYRAMATPFLVLPGRDDDAGPHPRSVGLELAETARHAELVADWFGESLREPVLAATRDFLLRHTP